MKKEKKINESTFKIHVHFIALIIILSFFLILGIVKLNQKNKKIENEIKTKNGRLIEDENKLREFSPGQYRSD